MVVVCARAPFFGHCSYRQWAAVKANMGAIDEMLDEVEKK